MSDRLPWKPHREGFLAYPEGNNRTTRYAALVPEPPPSQSWRWFVVCDTAKLYGVEKDRQSASEAAEAAWPTVERREWEDQTIALIYQAQAGKAGPAAFEIEKASNRDLLWTMERIEKRPTSPGLTQLNEAILKELSRRRGR